MAVLLVIIILFVVALFCRAKGAADYAETKNTEKD